MKAIIIIAVLLIGSLIVIDVWGIWTFLIILLVIIMTFALLVKKGTKIKEKRHSEAIASQNEIIQKKEPQYRKTNIRGTKPGFKFEDIEGHERLSGDILEQDLSEADPSDFFYDKKVVFTGKLSTYDREDLALLLKQRGADINTTISKKTDIVIIGDNPGPTKMEKIGKLLAAGENIVVIYEDDLEGYVII